MIEKLVHPEKNSTLWLWFLAVFFATIVALVFFRIYIARDFSLSREVDCDPENKSCFVRLCEEDDCVSEFSYYNLEKYQAKNVPGCSVGQICKADASCIDIPGCTEIFCDEANTPEGERCSMIGEMSNISGEEAAPSDSEDSSPEE